LHKLSVQRISQPQGFGLLAHACPLARMSLAQV
jgi:hypothetical protein